MNKYIIIVIFLLVNQLGFSNDSRTILGSSVEVIDNENTNIRMQEETINIKLYRNYYEVDVTFSFFNTAETETILLGFPVEAFFQQGVTGNKEWAVLNDFRSYINNVPLTEYIVREEIKYPEFEHKRESSYPYITHTTWYIREVVFPKNSLTTSRVTYKAPYGHGGFIENGGYIFGTGYNWKGSIEKMTINISHENDLILEDFNIGRFDADTIVNSFTWTGDGIYTFEFNDIEPIPTDRIRFYVRECNMFNATVNEFGHYYESWIWDEQLLYENIYDIKLFTKGQIRLFINFFYAIHGYNFRNEAYKIFFQQLRYLKSGNDKYVINPNFSENDFTETERKNIDYLLKLERMIP